MKISDRKLQANRENGEKSPGPKTEQGKAHSKLNAVKLGLFSRELRIAEANKPEFVRLEHELRAELAPEGIPAGARFR